MQQRIGNAIGLLILGTLLVLLSLASGDPFSSSGTTTLADLSDFSQSR